MGARKVDSVMTQGQAARFLQVSLRTLRRWRSCGDGPPYVELTQWRVRYRLTDLEAWLRSRTKAA